MERNQIETLKKSFDDYKHIDENGREYWNAHELSKAMGYTQYQNFKPAIERAKQSMISTGKNPDEHLMGSHESFISGNGSVRSVNGYKLDKYAAYNVAMNADPSKVEVAFAQEYFLQSTAKVEALEKRINDREYIENRNGLKLANKNLNSTLLSHDVKPEELPVVADAGDQGFFDMHTKEVKEALGIDSKRPVADFLGKNMAAYKAVAQINTDAQIKIQDARGVHKTSEIAFEENRAMRDMAISKLGAAPEVLATGEDVKKIEQKYNKTSSKYLDIIEQEF